MAKTTDVCVIGGGLQGCATALELRRRGVGVTVVERSYPGRHASGVNAGGVRRMNRAFAEIPLAVASHEIWGRIADHVGDDCGFRPTANIKIAETPEELRQVERRVAELRRDGYAHERVMSAEQVLEAVPALRRDFAGALACDGDGFANPFQTTHAFYRAAQREGAEVLTGTRADTVRRERHWQVRTAAGVIEAPILINCGGAWGNAIAAQLGDPAVVRAEAPMMMITETMPPFLSAVMGLVGHRLSFKQRANGTLLIGGGYRGTVNPDGLSARVDLAGLKRNANAAIRLFPHIADARIARSWAGVEGMTPDGLPIIGRSREHETAFHAFGFSAHGFQLGPIVGRILAELVTTGESSLPIDPFRISRFNQAGGST